MSSLTIVLLSALTLLRVSSCQNGINQRKLDSYNRAALVASQDVGRLQYGRHETPSHQQIVHQLGGCNRENIVGLPKRDEVISSVYSTLAYNQPQAPIHYAQPMYTAPEAMPCGAQLMIGCDCHYTPGRHQSSQQKNHQTKTPAVPTYRLNALQSYRPVHVPISESKPRQSTHSKVQMNAIHQSYGTHIDNPQYDASTYAHTFAAH